MLRESAEISAARYTNLSDIVCIQITTKKVCMKYLLQRQINFSFFSFPLPVYVYINSLFTSDIFKKY